MTWCFFFQAEDGIRDLVRSRGLGDVYKRQAQGFAVPVPGDGLADAAVPADLARLGDDSVLDAVIGDVARLVIVDELSLIHI